MKEGIADFVKSAAHLRRPAGNVKGLEPAHSRSALTFRNARRPGAILLRTLVKSKFIAKKGVACLVSAV